MLPRVDPRAYLGGIRASPRGCSRVPRGEVSLSTRLLARTSRGSERPLSVQCCPPRETRVSPRGYPRIPPRGSGHPARGKRTSPSGLRGEPAGEMHASTWGGARNAVGRANEPRGQPQIPATRGGAIDRGMRARTRDSKPRTRASHATKPREPRDRTARAMRPNRGNGAPNRAGW